MKKIRQFRDIEENEFFVVGVDTSAGGPDYCAAQFLSTDKLDVPIVYHNKIIATEMTPDLIKILNRIYDITNVRPVVAYERNNGGVFEMERISRLNKEQKFRPYHMLKYGSNRRVKITHKLGWDTNSATRPKMLGDLKEAIDAELFTIYDQPTIEELFSFITVQTTTSWRAQAETNAHDDLCFVAGTKILTEDGQVNIEDIRPGDMVMTRDGLKLVEYASKSCRNVISKFGLTGTPEHPIFTKNRGLVRLDKLKDSDIIYTWNEKQLSTKTRDITTSNQKAGSKSLVYNLQIKDTPEYFANNVLVHNCMSLAISWQLYHTENKPESKSSARAVLKNAEKNKKWKL